MLLANCFVAPKVTKVVHFEVKNCQNLFVSMPIFVQLRVRQQHPSRKYALLQVRVKTLNDELRSKFEDWHPGLKNEVQNTAEMPLAV